MSKWTTDKPEFTEDCWLVTFDGDGCTLWWISKTESDDGWYWGWYDQHGDEYGDIDNMQAKKYMVLPCPEKRALARMHYNGLNMASSRFKH